MFERYTISASHEKLHSSLNIDVPDNFKPNYNASPTRLLPVITSENPDGLSFFYWGLPPSMSKNKTVSKRLINAEIDLLEIKAAYKNALQKRRCLVIADGLYFWKNVSKKGKVPYRFVLNEQQPFLMAGFWDEFEDVNGEQLHTYNIITRPPSIQLSSFSESIPLILSVENSKKWLSYSVSDALSLLKDTLEIQFGFYPVSSIVNNIEINKQEMILESQLADQYGNYSLFD